MIKITGIKQAQIINAIVEGIYRRESNTSIKLMKGQRSNCTGVQVLEELLYIENVFYNKKKADILKINKWYFYP